MAQMIGYNQTTSKTVFFELKSGYLPTNNYLQPNVNVPITSDANYIDAWKAPGDVGIQECNTCHPSDPFLHSRWVVGARMPIDPSQPVLPEVTSHSSKYCDIGEEFTVWELKQIDLPGNNCLNCHRLSNINAWNFENNTDWILYMPPRN